ncbi:MAG TPA: CHAT domain-containing protein [Polyangia bacterium]|jgi:CHAT domain-containing protein/Flp pilus assembly protein TadD|nr:CHAT domain-containing protein [Polyangia bacterium]
MLVLVMAGTAQGQAAPATTDGTRAGDELRAKAFERLLARLAAIPERWDQLPPPRVPLSGKKAEDVLKAASKDQVGAAQALISALAQTLPAGRERIWQAAQRPLTEVDLWVPSVRVQAEQVRDASMAALTAEAWLELAERAGRRDVLFLAAGFSLNILQLRLPPPRVVVAARRWQELPVTRADARGVALVMNSTAKILVRLEDKEGALAAHRKARQLFIDVGDKQGEASTWLGEGVVLFRLGDTAAALAGHRKARQLFIGIGDKNGEATTWFGEGQVLFYLGDNAGALAAYRKARQLHVALGAKIGQANAWHGEAEVLIHVGDNAKALEAYRMARQLSIESGEKLGQANAWQGEATLRFRIGDTAGALEGQRRARQLYLDLGSKIGQVRTWQDEAQVLFHLGDNAGAREAYRTARQLSVEIGYKLGQANAWEGEARLQFRLGDNAGALEAFHEARQLYIDLGSKLGQADSWQGEAEVLFRFGDNAGALVAQRTARQLYMDIGDKLGQANTWQGEAQVLFRLGDTTRALEAHRKARQLYLSIGSGLGQAATWRGEADVLFRIGDNAGTLAAHRAARQLYLSIGSKLGQANTWRGEAEVLFRIGDSAGALAAYRTARQFYVDTDDKQGQASTWSGEAQVLFLRADTAGALAAQHASRQLLIEVGDKLGQANTWVGEAEALFLLGDDAGALAAQRMARQLYLAGGDKHGQANTWWGEAEVLERLGDLVGGAVAARKAVSLALAVADRWSELQARNELLRCLRRRDDPAVEAEARATLALLREVRKQGLTDTDRTRFTNLSTPYDVLVPRLARSPANLAEALVRAEEAHAPVLLDLLAGSQQTGSSLRPDLLQQREQVQQRLAALDEQIGAPSSAEQEATLRELRAALDQEILLIDWELAGARDTKLDIRAPLNSTERQQLVAAAGPVLLYYVAEDEAVGFLLLPSRVKARVFFIRQSREALREAVERFQHDLANGVFEKKAGPVARALYSILFGPIEAELAHVPRITIIPHGPLHELPFAALVDSEGQRLIERWSVAIAPSLSALALLRDRETARQQHAAGAPPFLALAAGRGVSLPDQLVANVATRLGAPQAVSYSQTTTYDFYREQAGAARHLLLSTHGYATPNDRVLTYLEINPSPTHDRRLSALEVVQIPLQAELVTLAACSTAAGAAQLSDERLDLTRAFLLAGASAVLATRWQVPANDETYRFLDKFYAFWRGDGAGSPRMRKDEALQAAQRWALAEHLPARAWAAWVLVGDGR